MLQILGILQFAATSHPSPTAFSIIHNDISVKGFPVMKRLNNKVILNL